MPSGNGKLSVVTVNDKLLPMATATETTSSDNIEDRQAGESASAKEDSAPSSPPQSPMKSNNTTLSDLGDDDLGSPMVAEKNKPTCASPSRKLSKTTLSDLDSDDDVGNMDETTAKKDRESFSSPHRLKKLPTTTTKNDSDDDVDFSQANPQKNQFVDDEADDDQDSLSPPATTTREAADGMPQLADPAHDMENNDDDDTTMMVDQDEEDDYPTAGTYTRRDDLPPAQPAFLPSATPLDLPRRFMCWNHIGSVTWNRGDRNMVDIQFTASAFRRPIHFTDNLGFIVGSLGEDGGLFCTDIAADEIDEDDDMNVGGFSLSATKAVLRRKNKPTGSTIYFHRFETIGALRDKDWYLTLPDGERALGCATGEGWAAVMTR